MTRVEIDGGSALRQFEAYGPGYRPDLVASHNRRTSSRDTGLGIGGAAVAAGLVTEEELLGSAQAYRAWGRDPAALDVITWCEAIGFKPPC